MLQHKIQRQKPPHDKRFADPSPVADVLDAQRPIDRVARYAARSSSPENVMCLFSTAARRSINDLTNRCAALVSVLK